MVNYWLLDDSEISITYVLNIGIFTIFSDAKAHWETLKQEMPVFPAQIATSNSSKKKKTSLATAQSPLKVASSNDPNHKDNSLRQFRKICLALSKENSHLAKTKIMKDFFSKGTDGGKSRNR